ncbi:hypothetical protein OIC43_09650 [Streptomyces sp. NBC_00825]|uniref:hypothetical protein n=1 Tax=unclassified Streptomyces TaxID=2593676 RepID=UPI002ED3D48A|nr:hypothetical protein OG832_34045 [Streptomyces sp. NBC_00826]WTH89285.1 hypothetical protein OIC43_09650 [Streptomyces sp. NBC_00825]WTH98010.1 hypothetical protein OHA23_09635 [Streptomyces sp. NBC_00822]
MLLRGVVDDAGDQRGPPAGPVRGEFLDTFVKLLAAPASSVLCRLRGDDVHAFHYRWLARLEGVNPRAPAARLDIRTDSERRMWVVYDAFCRDRWPVYWRYGAVSTGSLPVGVEIALETLSDLAGRWHTALRSSSPAAVAWGLLSAKSRASSTDSMSGLRQLLDDREADAFVLRNGLGLSVKEAGEVMGLGTAEFALLGNRALSKATALPSAP